MTRGKFSCISALFLFWSASSMMLMLCLALISPTMTKTSLLFVFADTYTVKNTASTSQYFIKNAWSFNNDRLVSSVKITLPSCGSSGGTSAALMVNISAPPDYSEGNSEIWSLPTAVSLTAGTDKTYDEIPFVVTADYSHVNIQVFVISGCSIPVGATVVELTYSTTFSSNRQVCYTEGGFGCSECTAIPDCVWCPQLSSCQVGGNVSGSATTQVFAQGCTVIAPQNCQLTCNEIFNKDDCQMAGSMSTCMWSSDPKKCFNTLTGDYLPCGTYRYSSYSSNNERHSTLTLAPGGSINIHWGQNTASGPCTFQGVFSNDGYWERDTLKIIAVTSTTCKFTQATMQFYFSPYSLAFESSSDFSSSYAFALQYGSEISHVCYNFPKPPGLPSKEPADFLPAFLLTPVLAIGFFYIIRYRQKNPGDVKINVKKTCGLVLVSLIAILAVAQPFGHLNAIPPSKAHVIDGMTIPGRSNPEDYRDAHINWSIFMLRAAPFFWLAGIDIFVACWLLPKKAASSHLGPFFGAVFLIPFFTYVFIGIVPTPDTMGWDFFLLTFMAILSLASFDLYIVRYNFLFKNYKPFERGPIYNASSSGGAIINTANMEEEGENTVPMIQQEEVHAQLLREYNSADESVSGVKQKMVTPPTLRCTWRIGWDVLPSVGFFLMLMLVVSLGDSFGGQLCAGIFLFMSLGTYLFRVYMGIRYASKTSTPVNLIELFYMIRSDPPVVVISCECYHFETRTRNVTRTNPDGSTYMTTETYQEKVVTFAHSEPFPFRAWSDQTGPLDPNVLAFNQLEVDFNLGCEAANVETEQAMGVVKARLDSLYQHRDTHYNSWYGYSCRALDPHLSAFPVVHREEDLPGIMTPLSLKAFASVGLLVVFTILQTRVCAAVKCTYRKNFSV